MGTGSFILVLHSHLPYCKKAGVWPFGEEWVFEALAETYIPALNILNDLREKYGRIKIAMAFTPILIEQLTDPYMIRRFEEYLDMKIQLASDDMIRFRSSNEERMLSLASAERARYEGVKKDFAERYGRDVIGAFRDLIGDGMVELVAGAATHAYLPLLTRKSSVAAQIRAGIESIKRYFGEVPSGLWLPLYGLPPDLNILREYGIGYLLLDNSAIECGRANLATSGALHGGIPTTYLPYCIAGTDLVALGRNRRTGLAVWSPEWGYPGDGAYREFHKRDSHSGLRYWRVTNKLVDLDAKEIYDPEEARKRAAEHADHFVSLVLRLLSEFRESCGTPGVILAPYDVELFGHWWSEGIEWLHRVLERLSASCDVELATPSSYLANHPPAGSITLPEATATSGIGHGFIRDAIRESEAKIDEAALKLGENPGDGLTRRLFNQAARELLLMESSDWPLLVASGQAGEYALARFSAHRERFERLVEALSERAPGAAGAPETLMYLEELEEKDGVFRYVDFADLWLESAGAG